MIGTTISHYRITGKIGQGGMGVVYEAEDTKLHRTVALKFLPESYLGSDTEKIRFMNEARAAAALSHPNICTVYEIDEADGRTFISMEYIEGRSLKDMVEAGPLELDAAVRYATQIARGLEEAHGKGVVHRDVKSANVVVSKKDHAIVMDFGLARIQGQTRVTQTGTTVGTVSYMSPEQARGDDVDHRGDIWSLGVVLYRMVVGKYPFAGEHQSAVMYAIMNEAHKPLTALRSDVPMALERIVDKTLAKDPAERYQSMADLIVDLKAVRKQIGSDSTAPSDTQTVPTAAPSSKRGRWIGVAVLVVVSVALAWWQFGGDGGERARPAGGADSGRVSIAVLPLDNMSGDESKEYFADGMTEALIAELAQVRALKVISRTSVMRFKNTQQSIAEIAGALGVTTIIEGSVMQAGDRVRVTAQLIDARTDEHLWAQSYERDASDVFALQAEVARAIVEQVRVELSPEDAERLASHESVAIDREAYDIYLKGKYHWNRRTGPDLNRALELFTQAVAIDSNYADAYAALASTHLVMANWTATPANIVYPAAREAAERALAIDPNHAPALAALAGVAQEWEWDWAKAGEYFRRSLAIDPSAAGVHQWYAEHLAQQGRFEEALAEIERARELDPLAMIIRLVHGWILTTMDRPQEAIAVYEEIIEMDPSWPATYLYIDLPYMMVGREKEGVEAMLQYQHLIGEDDTVARLREAYEQRGLKAYWMELVAVMRETNRSVGLIASYMAYAGEPDSALACIEKAYETHAFPVHVLAVSQWVRSLKDDPRYQAVIKKLGLEHVKPAFGDRP